uniref:Uncharacterized protein n=1 Tax=Gadus morhua TaxID=8049 RepID=A0A8C5C7D6_GADMO
ISRRTWTLTQCLLNLRSWNTHLVLWLLSLGALIPGGWRDLADFSNMVQRVSKDTGSMGLRSLEQPSSVWSIKKDKKDTNRINWSHGLSFWACRVHFLCDF